MSVEEFRSAMCWSRSTGTMPATTQAKSAYFTADEAARLADLGVVAGSTDRGASEC